MPNYILNEIRQLATLLNIQGVFPTEKSKTASKPIKNDDCQLYCGDNLILLYQLLDTYESKIDLCYIDPPYNTKNKFIYNDSRTSKKTSCFGTHSSWMEFMLPRLILAKQLLKDIGIIAVSIDDYEQPYLRILLDNIFGEENFIGNLVVSRSKNGKGGKKNIAVNHEYVILYGKTNSANISGHLDDTSTYTKEDQHGIYKIDGLFRKKGDASKKEDRPNMYYPLYYDQNGAVYTEQQNHHCKIALPVDSHGIDRRWLWGKDKASKDSWKLFASENGTIYVKNYYSHNKKIKIRSLWDDNRYLTERATKEIKTIFGEKIFETPKPLGLLEDLIYSLSEKDSLIIDFFAGTGTTAHATNNLNQLDNGHRKTILIEQNEKISNEHLAKKMGFNYIADITKKRLSYIKSINPTFSYSIIEQ
ncbi:MAG: site-specific DNA-methyltransferase [Sulfuricurvum sp.]|nr:site-specific DNA-methyltransferase [Sulfuricurvum sp.]